MDLWSAIKIVVRRWWIVVPAMLVTVVVAVFMLSVAKPSYRATGSVLFVAPSVQPGSDDRLNPFTEFTGSLQTTAAAVAQVINADVTRDNFEKRGLSTEFQLDVPNDPTRGTFLPSISITATDGNARRALLTNKAVIAAIGDELQRRQVAAKVPKDLWITTDTLTQSTQAIAITTGKLRLFAIVMLFGLAWSVSLAFIAESFSAALKRRREAQGVALAPVGMVPLDDVATESASAPVVAPATETVLPPQDAPAPTRKVFRRATPESTPRRNGSVDGKPRRTVGGAGGASTD